MSDSPEMLTDRPLVHGKRSTYLKRRCRCIECRSANAQYMASYRASRRERARQ